MNKKAAEHFARCAIENVFADDPEYICNTLFGGDWKKMYDYIVVEMGHCINIQFPDPVYTDIAAGWTEVDYDERSLFMCEKWDHRRMSDALRDAWDDEYCAVKYALKCGITLEDLE